MRPGRKPILPIVGEVHNRLTVIGVTPNSKTHWDCRCVCGNLVSVEKHSLRSGNTKSCGCLRKEVQRKRHRPRKVPPGLGVCSDAEIARREGITRERVRQIRVREGIPSPPRKGSLPDKVLQDFAAVWNQCGTMQQVMERTGKSYKEVKSRRNACARRGVAVKHMDLLKDKRDHFIALWNSAETVGDVAKELGTDRFTVSQKAYHLRKRGYPVKKMNWWKDPMLEERRQHFVTLWNSSKSIAEVVERTGLGCESLYVKASQMRKHGYPLKKMHKHGLTKPSPE